MDTRATLLVLLAALATSGCADRPPDPPATADSEPEFVGSVACRECHQRFYELWAPSHHGTAMQPVTSALFSEKLPRTRTS